MRAWRMSPTALNKCLPGQQERQNKGLALLPGGPSKTRQKGNQVAILTAMVLSEFPRQSCFQQCQNPQHLVLGSCNLLRSVAVNVQKALGKPAGSVQRGQSKQKLITVSSFQLRPTIAKKCHLQGSTCQTFEKSSPWIYCLWKTHLEVETANGV